MGACAILEAFFKKGKCDARGISRSQAHGDTEVPAKDIQDVETEGARLQAGLRELPEGGSIHVQSAREACHRVAVFDVPESLSPEITLGSTPNTKPQD